MSDSGCGWGARCVSSPVAVGEREHGAGRERAEDHFETQLLGDCGDARRALGPAHDPAATTS